MEAVKLVLVVMVVEGVLVVEFVNVVLVVLVLEGVGCGVCVLFVVVVACLWWYLGRLWSFCWL